MYQDIFRDTPAYQRIYAQGREEGIELARQEREKERQEHLKFLRELLVMTVQARFSKLRTLAKAQAKHITDVQVLEEVTKKVSMALTFEEAQDALLSCEPGDE